MQVLSQLGSVGLRVGGPHWIGPHCRCVIADIGLGECGEWRLIWSNTYMGFSPADGSSFDFFSFGAIAFLRHASPLTTCTLKGNDVR